MSERIERDWSGDPLGTEAYSETYGMWRDVMSGELVPVSATRIVYSALGIFFREPRENRPVQVTLRNSREKEADTPAIIVGNSLPLFTPAAEWFCLGPKGVLAYKQDGGQAIHFDLTDAPGASTQVIELLKVYGERLASCLLEPGAFDVTDRGDMDSDSMSEGAHSRVIADVGYPGAIPIYLADITLGTDTSSSN